MEEVWKDITGYEGLYQVSNLGRVKSLERWQYNPKCKDCKQYHPEQIRKPSDKNRHGSNKGYLKVMLYKNNVGKNFHVHRLVAEAFIPNTENKPDINHKNGDKHDNSVGNLEWCTPTENNKHAYVTGLNDSSHRRNCKGSKAVAQYDKNMNLIAVYPSIHEAERQTGIDDAAISRESEKDGNTAVTSGRKQNNI